MNQEQLSMQTNFRYCRRNEAKTDNFSSPLHGNDDWEIGDSPSIFYTKVAAVDTERIASSSADALPSTSSPEENPSTSMVRTRYRLKL